ncbi:SnoaL-like protein [Paraburkholderia sp. RAU2J]|uniref:nuclear transport factor 2 family protein n=1 Tax=Paraburkholderia sp. RAU2J TaxID=1938810 RepID=UPI000EAD7C13|nr:nuclear transport factor 2 family protein [Paraburkholderia sp. RAU2J]RKT22437.1 SnoaL-like protein [Paraburkholderia sp. RAU2J]
MNAHTDLIDRYFDVWNETDGARRRELIAATWSTDADYRDPLLAGAGHDGIDAMIRAVHERFPQHVFRRTTQVDGFANRLRFSWELTTPAGDAIVKGSDFGVVDAHGRLQAVTGFLDEAPGSA